MISRRFISVAAKQHKKQQQRSSSMNSVLLSGAVGTVAMGVIIEDDIDDGHYHYHRHHKKQQHRKDGFDIPMVNFTNSNSYYSLCDGDKERQQSKRRGFFRLKRNPTLRRMQDTSTKQTLKSKYDVEWDHPLGEGGFGTVYLGHCNKTKEAVAVKKIPKAFTDKTSFQKEMNAFLHIRDKGGHCHICSMKEIFDEGDHFYLVLDLVSGGEMFDHLCTHGAFSEADAARLVREVGSALAFIHGIGVVHGDLKPENLLLSSENSSDAVIKLVDFGCAQIIDKNSPLHDDNYDTTEGKSKKKRIISAITPGYSPPELLGPEGGNVTSLLPSMDMFSLGIILYVMLTGIHPFDLSGQSSDEEINERVKSCKKHPPPLRNSPITAHLSPSAIDLIEKLIEPNPNRRLSAQQMLNHPWVKGETARKGKIADSDKRLSAYRTYKSKLEAQVFANMVEWSEESKNQKKESNNVTKRTSLIERSFQMLDPERKGYITKRQLSSLDDGEEAQQQQKHVSLDDEDDTLDLSAFSDLLSENMKNRYFPAGHILYREGDRGDKMFFINSGRIEITTKHGYRATSEQGDFFGEGALLSKNGRRSASVKCVTPVHVIEISKEYLEKYLAKGAYGAKLTLAETDKTRKRNRAKTILSLQKNLSERTIRRGDLIYEKGDTGDNVFILEDGTADVIVENRIVFTVNPGELCGEFPFVFQRARNTSARCTSDNCTLHIVKSKDFHKLLRAHPSLKDTLRDTTLRREFQKALVFATKKPFPIYEFELREAFEAADYNKSGKLDLSDVSLMLKNLDNAFTDSEIKDILNSLDLDGTGAISWEEFKRIFKR